MLVPNTLENAVFVLEPPDSIMLKVIDTLKPKSPLKRKVELKQEASGTEKFVNRCQQNSVQNQKSDHFVPNQSTYEVWFLTTVFPHDLLMRSFVSFVLSTNYSFRHGIVDAFVQTS